jgi:hypothetical protein
MGNPALLNLIREKKELVLEVKAGLDQEYVQFFKQIKA